MNNINNDISKLYSNFISTLKDENIKNIVYYTWSKHGDSDIGLLSVNNYLLSNCLEKITNKQYLEEIKFLQHILGRLLINNTFNIENSFQLIKDRNWEYFYVFVDVHGTILKPDYGGLAKVYYPMAKEVLQKLSNDKRMKLVLYTCSYPNEIKEYLDIFEKDGIHFDEVNKNTDVENTRGGNFEDKPYFNVLLEDKAGFSPLDWYIINYILEKNK